FCLTVRVGTASPRGLGVSASPSFRGTFCPSVSVGPGNLRLRAGLRPSERDRNGRNGVLRGGTASPRGQGAHASPCFRATFAPLSGWRQEILSSGRASDRQHALGTGGNGGLHRGTASQRGLGVSASPSFLGNFWPSVRVGPGNRSLWAGIRPSERTRSGRKQRPAWTDSVSKRTECSCIALCQGGAGKSLLPSGPPTVGTPSEREETEACAEESVSKRISAEREGPTEESVYKRTGHVRGTLFSGQIFASIRAGEG
uniref:Uncharacterized protein n=1 Tax=Varanus komodoensis TaxID=61221 RepID=A0A8D2IPW1_VARKO